MKWEQLKATAVAILVVGFLGWGAVVGFGQAWLGWDDGCPPDPNPDHWWEMSTVNGTTDYCETSLLPLFGGVIVPMVFLLGLVGLVFVAVKARQPQRIEVKE